MRNASDSHATRQRLASHVDVEVEVGKDVVSAETTAPSAGKRPRKMWFAEKRDVCAAIAEAAKRHNQPPLQESGFKILAPLVGHLLNTGYDLALIRRVAVAATLDYDEVRRYSKLFQLRMRVRAEVAKIELDAHTLRMKTEREEIARSQTLATLADVKRLDPRRPLDERQDAAISAAESALYPRRPYSRLPVVSPGKESGGDPNFSNSRGDHA